MDKTYLSQIQNASLRERLLHEDHIPIVEELLNTEQKTFKRLRKLSKNKQLDFGKRISGRELRELVPRICEEVDDFLGTMHSTTPRAGYFNLCRPTMESAFILTTHTASSFLVLDSLNWLSTIDGPDLGNFLPVFCSVGSLGISIGVHSIFELMSYYNRLTREITLKREWRNELIPTIAHEYAHYLQHRELGSSNEKHRIFMEGHARGVERKISEIYRDRENNEAFLFDISERTVRELQCAYRWMCRELGKEEDKRLLENVLSKKEETLKGPPIRKKPSAYAIGNTLFSIYETREGDDFYNRALHGDFDFS